MKRILATGWLILLGGWSLAAAGKLTEMKTR